VTFVSPFEGWLLGGVACGGATCAAVLRTLDAGRTWASIHAPNAGLSTGPGSSNEGVSGLRFANARDGWAFGPDLWVTHDGGATWRKITITGSSGEVVSSLEAARGSVHAAFYDDSSGIKIATSPVGRDAWTVSATKIGFGPIAVARAAMAETSVTGQSRLTTPR